MSIAHLAWLEWVDCAFGRLAARLCLTMRDGRAILQQFLMGCAPPSRLEKWCGAARDVVFGHGPRKAAQQFDAGSRFPEGPFIALRARGSASPEPPAPRAALSGRLAALEEGAGGRGDR